MRIFHASDTTPNAAFESNLWRLNLCEPLVDLGHEVVEFDYDLRPIFRNLDPSDPAQKTFIDKTRPRTSRELLRQVRREHARKPIDVFFSYFYDACVLPEVIDEIRSLGILALNWYCNASYQLHLVSEIAPHYDWCLVPEKFRLADYVALGARPVYCQMAANPRVYKPCAVPADLDVTFVGQAYGERPALIRHILEAGIDVRVWGPGWRDHSPCAGHARRRLSLEALAHAPRRLLSAEGRRAALRWIARLGSPSRPVQVPGNGDRPPLPSEILGGPLADAEMIQMYSRSKVNLGFSSVGQTHAGGERIVQVRLRDFEVPMSGGFYMVEEMEELAEFFEIGREIVCYNAPGDLADKIRYFLSHDSERETIRQAGHRRALADHTWHKRFQAVFERIGLPSGRRVTPPSAS